MSVTSKNGLSDILFVSLHAISRSSDAFPPLKSAAEIALIIAELIYQFKGNKEAWKAFGLRLANDIKDIDAHLAKFDEVPQDLEDSVDEFVTLLETIKDSITQKQLRSRTGRFRHLQDDPERIQEYNEKINRALEKFKFQTIVAERVAIQRIEKHQEFAQQARLSELTLMQKLAQQQARDAEFAKLNIMQPADAAWNSGSREGATGCFQNTREKVLHDIYSWFGDDTLPRILWLSGLAGIGKSTIAHTVAQHYHEEGKLGASFFFSQGVEKRDDALCLFTTIAYQLAKFNPEFRSQLCRILDDDRDATRNTIQQQLANLIVQPLKAMDGMLQPAIIIIDALDECSDEDHASTILKVLASSIGRLRPFKFLITSRPEYHIRTPLASHIERSIARSLILHDLEKSIVQADIRLFLQHHLSEISRDRHLGTSWPSTKEMDRLVSMSSNLFIFASTVIKFLKDKHRRDPRRQLEVLFHTRPSPVGSSPFKDLDALYQHVLERALPEFPDEDLTTNLQIILSAVALLRDPLPPPSLERLLGQESGSLIPALDLLHSILAVPANTETQCIRVIHPSFVEFLTDGDRCQDSRFFIREGTYHGRLASRCFENMALNLRQDICDIKDYSTLNEDLGHDMILRLDERVRADLRYACNHWAYHLSQSAPGDSTLLDHLTSFCFAHLLHWLEILSLCGCLDAALPCLKSARSWLQRVKGFSPRLDSILNDTHRFVLAFYEPITKGALHVYHSALAFTPRNTVLYETFRHELPNTIKVIRGQEDNWSPCLRTIEGHSGSVNSIALSNDGLRIASSSSDGTIRLWDALTGTEILKFVEGHTGTVNTVDFSADGSRIVSGSDDETVRVWDALTGAEQLKLDGHLEYIKAVAFSTDGTRIASASGDKTVRVWDSTTGGELLKLEGHSSKVKAVAFSTDGAWVISGGTDRTVRVWNMSTGAETLKLTGHSDSVKTVAFSTDGTRIASGSGDGTVRIWNASNGVSLLRLEGHADSVKTVAFSRDGTRLASGSSDRTIRVWNAATGAGISVLQGHSRSVNSARFSSDGTWLVTGSSDWTIQVWDSSTINDSGKLESPPNTVKSVAFSIDGKRIASGTEDGAITVWDSSVGTELMKLKGHSDWVNSVEFSRDGVRLVSGSDDATVRIWDLVSEAETMKLAVSSGSVTSARFSNDGGRVVSGSLDGTIIVWDSSSGTAIFKLEGHSAWRSLAFSNDGTHIISTALDGKLRAWSISSGVEVAENSSIVAVSVSRSEVSIHSLIGAWIVRITGVQRRLSWIPASHRGLAQAWYGTHVVVGTSSGKVSIFELTPDNDKFLPV